MSDEVVSLLLLEPDRATRQLYARELGKRWRVIAVERAGEVLDVFAAQPIDAIILGFGAVDAEQWQLLAALRQQASSAALPIIVCSSVDERGKGYELGATAYLVKLVSPRQLSGEVARWVDSQVRAEEPH